MNKYQKETEKILLEHEQELLKELKSTYAQALAETKNMTKELQSNIEILENNDSEDSIIQSKIYRLNYQKAIENQLSATIDVLNSKNVSNIQSFLTKTYEDSYLSVNYNLNKQGMAIFTMINPQLMIDTINTPTENLKFSERLYDNTKQLKKIVKSEISRGIATSRTYSEISKSVAARTEADFYKSYRIARTEGGRVSSEARLEAMKNAKDKGADIVKQWDATLDLKTREEHAMLDQQIRELDEPFEVGGMEAMAPHEFGIAAMDINCRCVLLSIPRWSIQERNLKYDSEVYKETKQLIAVKNYSEWKEKYYNNLDWYKNMSSEQKESLLNYISSDSYKINDLLNYSRNLTKEYKSFISNLDKALDNAPIWNGTVYRSVNIYNQEHLNGILEIFENPKKTGSWNSYISSSKNVYDSNMKLQLKIKSKTGRDISILNTEGDGEILFKRNAKFRYVDAKIISGKIYINLEEI